jgi:hypothetical protein
MQSGGHLQGIWGLDSTGCPQMRCFTNDLAAHFGAVHAPAAGEDRFMAICQ